MDTTNTIMKTIDSALGRAELVAIFHQLEGNASDHVLAANTFLCTRISAPTIVLTVNISQH